MAGSGSGCDRFASEVQETTELHFESTQEKISTQNFTCRKNIILKRRLRKEGNYYTYYNMNES